MKTVILSGILSVAIFFAWYALRPAGEEESATLFPSPAMSDQLSLASSAFKHNGRIPPQYTCGGENVSPPLSWSGAPEGAVALALIMDDPDVPKVLRPDGIFDHWVVFNMPPVIREIKEGERTPGVMGANGAGKNAYTGPCPPPQYEPKEHRYIFKLYALDAPLALSEGASKAEVLSAMEGHVLMSAELIGRYSRE